MADQGGVARKLSLDSRMFDRNASFQREDYSVAVLQQPRKSGAVDSDHGSREFTAAMDLIREASEAARINDSRIADMESEIESLRAASASEVESLRMQLSAAHTKIASLEEQVESAEARATSAAMWLSKLHDAIVTSFSPVLKRDGRTASEHSAAAPVRLR